MGSSTIRIGVILFFLLALFLFPMQTIQAGGKKQFSVNKLKGWEAAFNSPRFDSWYDFDFFWKYDGKWITPEKYYELHKQWKDMCRGVRKKIDRYRNDSEFRFQANLEFRLEKHPYFSRVKNFYPTVVQKPFLFFVQEPPDKNPKYKNRVIHEYDKAMRAMENRFISQYVEPYGWKKRENDCMYAIAILASEGAYSMFYKALTGQSVPSSRAHYDPEHRIAVTYGEFFAANRGLAKEEEHQVVLHEFVHALQAAYSTEQDLPKPIWFCEGLAEYLSQTHNSYEENLKIVGALLLHHTGHLGKWYLSSLRALVSPEGPGYESVVANANARIAKSGSPIPSDPVKYRLHQEISEKIFYSQSAIMMQFLHEGAGGRYRPGLMKYTDAVMRGRSGWSFFVTAFEDTAKPQELWTDFKNFIEAECRKEWPNLKFKPDRLLDHDVLDALDVPGLSATLSDLSQLSLSDKEFNAKLGAILYVARSGDFQGAVKLAQKFMDSGCTTTERVRLERERERIEQLDAYRKEFLAQKVKKKRPLRFLLNGEKIACKIVSFGEDLISVKPTKPAGPEVTLPLEEVGPANLMVMHGRAGVRGEKRWLGAYLSLLAGVRSYEKYLDRKDEQTRQLQQDIEGCWKPLEVGEAAWLLESIARGKVPKDPKEARLCIYKLKKMRPYFSLDLLKKRGDALKTLAKAVLTSAFDPQDFSSFGLWGKVRKAGSKKVKLLYGFEKKEEERDFVEVKKYLEGFHKSFGEGDGMQPSFLIENGVLSLRGAGCYRFMLPFSSPFTVRYRLSFNDLPSSPTANLGFMLGLCDDSCGSFLGCLNFGALMTVDLASGFQKHKKPLITRFLPGQVYEIQLDHDGEHTLTCSIGEKMVKVSCGSRRRGWLFLWAHMEGRIEIDEIEIDAALDEGSIGMIRKKWLQRNLDELGLDNL